MDQPWVTGALVVVTVLHALVLFAAFRARRRANRSGAASADRTEAGVACPDCETRNDPTFRFCRECLAELPGPGEAGRGGEAATSRRPL